MYRQRIAKIASTSLGVEDHGVLTAYLTVDYGGAVQAIGGYGLDRYDAEQKRRVGTAYGCEFIARVIRACGVAKWEDVAGRTIYVLQDLPEGTSVLGTAKVVGIENLPTEPGERFVFADLADEFRAELQAASA